MIQESACGIHRTQIKREHRTRPLLLPARDIVMRMRRQSRVIDLAHLGVGVQVPRNRNPVRVVLEHPHGQGLNSTRHQKAIHRREPGPRRALNKVDFLRVLRARQDHSSACRIAVPVQILGHRVHDDVRSELDGALQVGAHERVIDRDGDVPLAGKLRNGRNVGHVHGRIRGRFDVQHLGVRAHGHAHSFGHRSVHEAEFQPKMHQQLRGKPENAAIHGFRQNHVVSGAQQTENGIDSCHSRGENVSAVPAFELGNGAFESFAIRVAGTRVVVSLVLSELFVDIRRSLIDRRDDRARGRIRLLAHMNGIGGKTHDALLALSHTFLKQAASGWLLTVRGHFQDSTVPVLHCGAGS